MRYLNVYVRDIVCIDTKMEGKAIFVDCVTRRTLTPRVHREQPRSARIRRYRPLSKSEWGTKKLRNGCILMSVGLAEGNPSPRISYDVMCPPAYYTISYYSIQFPSPVWNTRVPCQLHSRFALPFSSPFTVRGTKFPVIRHCRSQLIRNAVL